MGQARQRGNPRGTNGGDYRYDHKAVDPEKTCRICKHKHRNKNCFVQHPELRQKYRQENSGRIAHGGHDTESDDDDSHGGVGLELVHRATSAQIRDCPLYDTGALHHFMKNENAFLSLSKLKTPFKFDQAVGVSTLSHKGTCHLSIGKMTLKLNNALFSPGSSCSIISAVRLKDDHIIVSAQQNELLVYDDGTSPVRPVARLVPIGGVLFIEPMLRDTYRAAQGVARVPKASSAQRWYERLGHVGQKILKNTANNSIGMEGIDTSELTTCETCHLSKAQRYVSREPRSTPGELLEVVFIDTIGKLTESTNGLQNAVIITDTTTRMRWVLKTKTKDVIASEL